MNFYQPISIELKNGDTETVYKYRVDGSCLFEFNVNRYRYEFVYRDDFVRTDKTLINRYEKSF